MNSLFLILILSTLFGAEFKSQRQYVIEQQLHAPCCWGGVIAEHDSPLANSIKMVVKAIVADEFDREEINSALQIAYENENIHDYSQKHITEDMTDTEIVEFFIGIHGEKIRALPENTGLGWVAWKLPTFMLVLSLIVAMFIINKFRSIPKKSVNIGDISNFKKVDDEMKKMGI